MERAVYTENLERYREMRESLNRAYKTEVSYADISVSAAVAAVSAFVVFDMAELVGKKFHSVLIGAIKKMVEYKE